MKYKIKVVYKWWFITRTLTLSNIPRRITKVVDNLCSGDIFHLKDGNNKHFYINTKNIIYMIWEEDR